MSADCNGAERRVEFGTRVDYGVGGDADAVCAGQRGGFSDDDRGCEVDGGFGDFDGDAGSGGHGVRDVVVVIGELMVWRGRFCGELFLVLAA